MIVRDLVHLAQKAAQADAAGLWLLDSSGKSLRNIVYDGLPQQHIDCVRELPLGSMTCGRAVLERKPVVERDIRNDPEYKAAWKTPVRGCFSVPVIGYGGRIHGSLACHFTKVHSPSPYDIERNQLFAQLIAFAIDESSAKSAA